MSALLSTTPLVTAGLLLAVAALLAGCCGEEEPADPAGGASELSSAVYCPTLVQLQERSGLSIGGLYGGATFAEYRISARSSAGTRGGIAVTAPNDTPCAQDIARRLEQTCELCKQDSGSCSGLTISTFSLPTQTCAVCGDLRCTSPAEDRTSCAEDCRCGDGSCDSFTGEDLFTCPQDCRGACGDGFCAQPVEQCTCPEGDPTCEACPRDCCVSACGDARCDVASLEHILDGPNGCENDCGPGYCGDGSCQATENNASCPRDCAQLLRCGDAVCASPETPFNCPSDCQDQEGSRCLDGVCSGGEFWTCASDCQGLDFDCGNGVCSGVEDAMNCPLDCPAFTCGDSTCEVERGESRPLCAATCAQQGGASCDDRCPAPTCVDDGYCSYGELAMGGAFACADCHPCSAEAGDCLTDSSSCGTLPAAPTQHAVMRCAVGARCGGQPEAEPCEGSCRYTPEGAACSTCPTTLPLRMSGMAENAWTRLCPEDFQPTCVGANVLRTCAMDPDYSADPGCQLVSTVYCRGGCVEGACNTQPRINSLTPNPLLAGDTLNIDGFIFETTQGTITFSPGVTQAPITWSDTHIEVIVPQGAESGPLTVTTAGGESVTRQLTVITSPTILRAEPASGERGETTALVGFLFGDAPGQVLFPPSDIPAPIISWSERRVEVTVPAGATSGQARLRTQGGQDAPFNFTVEPSIPMNPVPSATSGHIGETVTISGSGFGISGQVLFWVGVPEFEGNDPNGLEAEIIAWTPTMIQVRVPNPCGTSLGGRTNYCSSYQNTPIVVRTPEGRAVTEANFRALPTLAAMTVCGQPWSGRPFDLVEVTGAGFGSNSLDTPLRGISFGPLGAPGVIEVRPSAIDGPSRLWVTVPSGAPSGLMSLRWVDPEGQERITTTTQPFTVTPWPDGDALTLLRVPGDSPTAVCTDGTSVIDCASAAPQDGTTVSPAPSLTLEEELLTDEATGLIWQRVGQPGLDRASAQCACRAASTGGQSGWRLPSAAEVSSLIDFGAGPGGLFPDAIDPGADAIGLWAREADSGISSSALFNTVSLENGTVQATGPQDFRQSTLCVQRPPVAVPSPRFAVATGRFTDQASGLTWTLAPEGFNLGWGAALQVCANSTAAGFDDWRVPTLKELLTVMDFLSIDTVQAPFEGLSNSARFWTSTPFIGPESRRDLAFAYQTHLNAKLWNTGVRRSNGAELAGVFCVR